MGLSNNLSGGLGAPAEAGGRAPAVPRVRLLQVRGRGLRPRDSVAEVQARGPIAQKTATVISLGNVCPTEATRLRGEAIDPCASLGADRRVAGTPPRRGK
jgi:hypothetical protein